MTCSKVAYKSKSKALLETRASRSMRKVRIRAYKCPDCSKFHVTSCRKQVKIPRYTKVKHES